jgi:hypothetical protein
VNTNGVSKLDNLPESLDILTDLTPFCGTVSSCIYACCCNFPTKAFRIGVFTHPPKASFLNALPSVFHHQNNITDDGVYAANQASLGSFSSHFFTSVVPLFVAKSIPEYVKVFIQEDGKLVFVDNISQMRYATHQGITCSCILTCFLYNNVSSAALTSKIGLISAGFPIALRCAYAFAISNIGDSPAQIANGYPYSRSESKEVSHKSWRNFLTGASHHTLKNIFIAGIFLLYARAFFNAISQLYAPSAFSGVLLPIVNLIS